jgi:hypothetical protein
MEELTSMLQNLKGLVGAGLIEQKDYDEKKGALLDVYVNTPIVAQAEDHAGKLGYLKEAATDEVLRFAPLQTNERAGDGVTVEFKGTGYNSDSSLTCVVHNQSPNKVTLRLRAGRVLVPTDGALLQNLILKSEYVIVVAPSAKVTKSVFAFCGNVNFGCTNRTTMALTDCTVNTNCLVSQAALWARLTGKLKPSRSEIDTETGRVQERQPTKAEEEQSHRMVAGAEQIIDEADPQTPGLDMLRHEVRRNAEARAKHAEACELAMQEGQLWQELSHARQLWQELSPCMARIWEMQAAVMAARASATTPSASPFWGVQDREFSGRGQHRGRGDY